MMPTIETKTAMSITEDTCQSNELKAQQADKLSNHELLITSALTALGTVMGTAALLSIHHRYRKQRQPDSSWQDYLTGICSQLHSLPSISKPPLMRFSSACQQAACAWQQAYALPINDVHHSNNSLGTTDFSAMHTTTMLARPVCWVSGVAAMPKNISLINDDSNDKNDFGVVGIDADREIVWQTTMPERVHDIVVQPILNDQDNSLNSRQSCQNRDVVVMGRRPSEKFWVLDTATGQVKFAIKASDQRHFYGHACYSLDGSTLYVTENDTQSLDGKIGVYNAHGDYQKVAEFDSHGIGPHELIMHPDDETLVIANGGIKTEQASREELNLDIMLPSLVYLNRHDGKLLEQITPEHNQMSVRHLAMHNDGTVMIGIQFQGEKHINVPLVLTHKRGDTNFKSLTMPDNQWQRFHQYIASVAVDSERNLLCVTTPIGGCAAIFDLNSCMLINDVSLPDCAGASVLANSVLPNNVGSDINNDVKGKDKCKESCFIVSDGQGQLTKLHVDHLATVASAVINKVECITKDSKRHMMSFDNHLQAL